MNSIVVDHRIIEETNEGNTITGMEPLDADRSLVYDETEGTFSDEA